MQDFGSKLVYTWHGSELAHTRQASVCQSLLRQLLAEAEHLTVLAP